MKKLFVSLFAALIGVSALNALNAQDAKPADAKPAAADATKLMLGVVPNVMQYDKKELTVKAGAKVMLLFRNEKCPLQHNFILLKPGTKDAVGALANAMLADPQGMAKSYIPEAAKPDLLANTKLVQPNQTETIEFTAPAAGDYPYLCTFPGHGAIMNGVMKVK